LESSNMLTQYIAEEFDRKVIKSQHGFVSYKIIGKEFLIGDMFVERMKRSEGLGQELGRICEDLARDSGCSYLSCNVYVDETRPEFTTRKVRIFIDYGFKVLRISGSQIIMIKELEK